MIVDVPGATLLTAPDVELTVATPVELLDHVPPDGLALNVVPVPLHMSAVPVIAPATALTVTVAVAEAEAEHAVTE